MTDRGKDDALRLDMGKALSFLNMHMGFKETGPSYFGNRAVLPDTLISTVGDVVISRKSGGVAYHLAVVVDDAFQQISEVVRGEDLFEATQIHVILQHLLALPTPLYHHHTLIRDAAGKRLAKRDDARAIATYRADGATPADIRHILGL